jgi:phosphoribosylanthranilate isomerase
MINGISVKVCGITSVEDAEAAYACGADFLGFIQYPKSPRYITLEAYQKMLPKLPPLPKIGVVVFESLKAMEPYRDAGFDFIQFHFPNETPFCEAVLWADIIAPEKMWAAPRVPPGKDLDLAFLPLADTFLLDSYHPLKVGGSGMVADWYQFYRLQANFQYVRWFLAGGLNPENIAGAIKESEARNVDVNSGVELRPGVKDHAKLKAFFQAIARSVPVPT